MLKAGVKGQCLILGRATAQLGVTFRPKPIKVIVHLLRGTPRRASILSAIATAKHLARDRCCHSTVTRFEPSMSTIFTILMLLLATLSMVSGRCPDNCPENFHCRLNTHCYPDIDFGGQHRLICCPRR
ncbi:uncharacterized protein LOC119109847 [Pollicipes pollicipes]|uniref:uncharacterized protein LOC119109847 n=1 Tax=Pollicipes pollicipes TaxID=41117 RepID=UPI001884C87D|nr:uncharacterized protein LOC119109847 [Pollicipes pollicipes]